MDYVIKKASGTPCLSDDFTNGEQWKNANIINVDIRMDRHFPLWKRLLGYGKKPLDDFMPETQLKLLYDDKAIYGLFKVKDKYLLARHTGFQDQVCEDSCVEIFIHPQNEKRYYNFEFNASGAFLNYNITNLRAGIYSEIPFTDGKKVEIFHSLPDKIYPEQVMENAVWYLGFSIPFAFFEKYGDNIKPPYSQQTWTAGVYKCSELSSHPHWLSWQALPKLDFHQPATFGKIRFE